MSAESIPPTNIGLFSTCVHCAHENEHPYFFCEECGAPRGKLGKWVTTFNISISMSAFLGFFYFGEDVFNWAWPLYILYSLYFGQFSLALVTGVWRYALRFGLWFLIFFPLCGLFFHFINMEGGSPAVVLWAPAGLWEVLTDPDYFIVGYTALAGVVLLVFVPCYIRWVRRYGWTYGYRIVLMSLLAIACLLLVAFWAADVAYRADLFPAIREDLERMVEARSGYHYALSLFALTAFRVLLIEMLVVAAVRGYATTHKRMARERRPNLSKESGFIRAMFHIVQILRRLARTIENMLRYTVSMIGVLARDFWQVLLVFVRELLLPAAAMLASAALVYLLAHYTAAYVAPPETQTALSEPAPGFWRDLFSTGDFFDRERWAVLGKVMAALLALLFSLMVFLWCKTRYRWSRIMSFYGQLVSWLLPNLLVFFLIISASLVASSAVLNQYEDDLGHSLPFRLGLLTKVVFLVLAALVAIIVMKKRTLFLSEPLEDEDGALAADENVLVVEETLEEDETPTDAPRQGGETEPKAKPKKTRRRLIRLPSGDGVTDLLGRSLESASSVLRNLGGEDMAESARGLRERLTGQPPEILDLIETRALYRKKVAQLEALEETRETISKETYEDLKSEYTDEMLEVSADLAHLQEAVDKLYEGEMVENKRILKDLNEIQAQEKELATLLKAGAISETDHRDRMRDVNSDMQLTAQYLKKSNRILKHLKPQVSARFRPDEGEEDEDEVEKKKKK